MYPENIEIDNVLIADQEYKGLREKARRLKKLEKNVVELPVWLARDESGVVTLYHVEPDEQAILHWSRSTIGGLLVCEKDTREDIFPEITLKSGPVKFKLVRVEE
jgi:hypothetical protein